MLQRGWGFVKVNLYTPAGRTGRAELAGRVAAVHGDAVIRYIGTLSCSHKQKVDLLEAVIAAKKQEAHPLK